LLTGGNRHDAPAGRNLLEEIITKENSFLLMDRAYEGNKTRSKAIEQGFIPVVPPKKNRIDPWEYDKELYKRRNEIERFFRRLKRFRRIFTRYDKLDIIFSGFIFFALIIDSL